MHPYVCARVHARMCEEAADDSHKFVVVHPFFLCTVCVMQEQGPELMHILFMHCVCYARARPRAFMCTTLRVYMVKLYMYHIYMHVHI
jgi:hypothetical protein